MASVILLLKTPTTTTTTRKNTKWEKPSWINGPIEMSNVLIFVGWLALSLYVNENFRVCLEQFLQNNWSCDYCENHTSNPTEYRISVCISIYMLLGVKAVAFADFMIAYRPKNESKNQLKHVVSKSVRTRSTKRQVPYTCSHSTLNCLTIDI